MVVFPASFLVEILEIASVFRKRTVFRVKTFPIRQNTLVYDRLDLISLVVGSISVFSSHKMSFEEGDSNPSKASNSINPPHSQSLPQFPPGLHFCRFRPLVFISFNIFCLQQFKNQLKRTNMSEYNLNHMGELESYGEHLFCLEHKYLSFLTEQPQEKEVLLMTETNSSERCRLEKTGKSRAVASPWIDDHFQMSFMKEHAFTAQKYIRNYMELFLKNCQGEISQANSQRRQGQKCNLQEVIGSLQRSTPLFPGGEQEMQRVSQDLQKKEKVVSFLTSLLEEQAKFVSYTLIKVALVIWGEYCKLDDSKFGEREIIEYTNRLLTSSFLRRINLAFGGTAEGAQLPKLKTFMNVFTNTLLFIANEYFLNPYYQLEEELTVREFQNYELFLYDNSVYDDASDEEEYQQTCGRKMVKEEGGHSG